MGQSHDDGEAGNGSRLLLRPPVPASSSSLKPAAHTLSPSSSEVQPTPALTPEKPKSHDGEGEAGYTGSRKRTGDLECGPVKGKAITEQYTKWYAGHWGGGERI